MQECLLDGFGRGQWRPSGLVRGSNVCFQWFCLRGSNVWLQWFCCLLMLTREKMHLQFKKWCFSLFRTWQPASPVAYWEKCDDVKQMRIAFVIDHFIYQLVTDLIRWTNFLRQIWCFHVFHKKKKLIFNSSLLTLSWVWVFLPIKRSCFFFFWCRGAFFVYSQHIKLWVSSVFEASIIEIVAHPIYPIWIKQNLNEFRPRVLKTMYRTL